MRIFHFKLKMIIVLLVACFVGIPANSSWAIPERLNKAISQCPKWIRLSVENTHFIWELPHEKRPFLIQLESACYPGFMESRQLEILKDWVAQGNILWIIFNPLRGNIPGNTDWATYFGLKAFVSPKSAVITKKDGLILPVRGLSEEVEIIQLGTPNITPSYYFFEGNIIPVLKDQEGHVVFGGQNFGAGRIIFDGFGWLFFETEKDWIDPLTYDSEVFWVNFFKWARACVKPAVKKEEKVESYVPSGPPRPTIKESIDCAAVSRELKNKCPNLEIRVMERSNGDCVISLDRVLFDTGKADIREEGLSILDAIADILKEHQNYSVRIEGHTDSMPIRGRLKKRFPTNWELSRARSEAVYHYFLEKGQVSGSRMARAGFADTRPVAGNKTKEGRQQNRRTEIILYIKTPLNR